MWQGIPWFMLEKNEILRKFDYSEDNDKST